MFFFLFQYSAQIVVSISFIILSLPVMFDTLCYTLALYDQNIMCTTHVCLCLKKNGIDDYTLLTVWYSDQTSKVRIKPKTWMTLLSSWQKWVPDPYPNHWGGTSSSYSAQTNSGTGALKYNLKKNTNIYS